MLLSLSYIFLLGAFLFLVSTGLLVFVEFKPNALGLSDTAVNKLFAVAGVGLLVTVTSSAFYVMFFFIPAVAVRA